MNLYPLKFLFLKKNYNQIGDNLMEKYNLNSTNKKQKIVKKNLCKTCVNKECCFDSNKVNNYCKFYQSSVYIYK